LLLALGIAGSQAADEAVLSKPTDSPGSFASPSPRDSSFKERLAAAQSVKVETKLLGLELGSTLEQAHERLDSLGDPAQPASEGAEGAEEAERERKILWKLAKSDFSSILVKTDEKERVTYMMGLLRPGKEIPFDQIGQTEKAPILTEHTVAWDVVRPDKSLLRVVARGEKSKANAITIFMVKGPPPH
jgi:hypothetical protein